MNRILFLLATHILLLGLIPAPAYSTGDEPTPPSEVGPPAPAESVDTTPSKPYNPWTDEAAPTPAHDPEPELEAVPDEPENPPETGKARRFFSETYQKLGDIIAGRDDIVFFASMSVVQARMVYDDEVPNDIDPNAGRPLRPVASSSVIYGQLNLGYRVEQWISWLGSAGAFIEADLTDLRRETDHGRFGVGLYLAGPKGFRVLNYLNPTFAVGYRHQADRCLEDRGAGFQPIDCKTVDWENIEYQTLINEVSGTDITNFFISLNIAVPLDCLFDKEACEDHTR